MGTADCAASAHPTLSLDRIPMQAVNITASNHKKLQYPPHIMPHPHLPLTKSELITLSGRVWFQDRNEILTVLQFRDAMQQLKFLDYHPWLQGLQLNNDVK